MADDVLVRLTGEEDDLVAAINAVLERLDNLADGLNEVEGSGDLSGRIENLRELAEGARDTTSSFKDLVSGSENASEVLDEVGEGAKNTADEVLQSGDAFEQFADLVETGYGRAVAALATFTAAYKTTRNVIDSLRDQGIIDIDQLAQEILQLDRLTEAVIGGTDALKDQAAAALDTQNKINILTKNGYDVAGVSVERLNEIYGGFLQTLQESRTELRRQSDAIDELISSVAGLTFDQFVSQFEDLERVTKGSREELQDLLDGPLGEETANRIERLGRALDVFAESADDLDLDERLQLEEAIADFRLYQEGVEKAQAAQDSWNSVQEEAAARAKEADAAYQQQRQSIQELADSFASSREQLQQQTDTLVGAFEVLEDSGRLTADSAANVEEAVDDLIQKFQEAGVEVPDALEQIKDKVGDLAKFSVERFEEIKDALEELGDETIDQAERVADALRDAARDSEDAARGIGRGIGSGAADEASRSIEQVQAELESLQERRRTDTIITEEAIQREQELKRELFLLEREQERARVEAFNQQQLQSQSTAIAQQQVAQLIADSKLRVDEFRDSFPALGTAATTQLDLLVSNLQTTNDIGQVNADTIEDFGAKFEAALKQAQATAEAAFGTYQRESQSANEASADLNVTVDETTRIIKNAGEAAREAGADMKQGFTDGALGTAQLNEEVQESVRLVRTLASELQAVLSLLQEINGALSTV